MIYFSSLTVEVKAIFPWSPLNFEMTFWNPVGMTKSFPCLTERLPWIWIAGFRWQGQVSQSFIVQTVQNVLLFPMSEPSAEAFSCTSLSTILLPVAARLWKSCRLCRGRITGKRLWRNKEKIKILWKALNRNTMVYMNTLQAWLVAGNGLPEQR